METAHSPTMLQRITAVRTPPTRTRTPNVTPTARTRRPRFAGPIPVAILAGLIIGGGFVAYQRIGTRANADVIETTENLGGGFLAVGYSDDQPGFLLASALDEERIRFDAAQVSYFLAGKHTNLVVETDAQGIRKRLRDPVVITIDRDGRIATAPVDWSRFTFKTLAEAVDCEHKSPLIKKHCGAPFLDVRARIARWPLDAVPAILREFLAATP